MSLVLAGVTQRLIYGDDGQTQPGRRKRDIDNTNARFLIGPRIGLYPQPLDL